MLLLLLLLFQAHVRLMLCLPILWASIHSINQSFSHQSIPQLLWTATTTGSDAAQTLVRS